MMKDQYQVSIWRTEIEELWSLVGINGLDYGRDKGAQSNLDIMDWIQGWGSMIGIQEEDQVLRSL